MINTIYQALAGNLFFGGIAAALLLFLMFRKAARVAAGGNKAAMTTWAAAPAIMVIASVVITGAAIGIALPRLQAMFTSAPVQNALSMGSDLTAMADTLLAGGDFSTVSQGGGYSVPAQTSVDIVPSGIVPAGTNTFTAPDGTVYEVSPPDASAVELLNQESATATTATTSSGAAAHDWSSYTIRTGDSMASIARRYGLSLGDLCGMNVSTIGGNCNLIRRGQVIKLPTSNGQPVREVVQIAKPVWQRTDAGVVAVRPTPAPQVRQAAANGAQTYTIQPGDTIFSIAQKHGGLGNVYKLCSANRQTLGDNCDNMVAGSTIVIK